MTGLLDGQHDVGRLDQHGDRAALGEPELVPDRARVVTIAAKRRGAEVGIRVIRGDMPESAAYRHGVRADLVRLAAEGRLEVPMARTYPLERALDAAELLRGRHPGGQGGTPPHSLRLAGLPDYPTGIRSRRMCVAVVSR